MIIITMAQHTVTRTNPDTKRLEVLHESAICKHIPHCLKEHSKNKGHAQHNHEYDNNLHHQPEAFRTSHSRAVLRSHHDDVPHCWMFPFARKLFMAALVTSLPPHPAITRTRPTSPEVVTSQINSIPHVWTRSFESCVRMAAKIASKPGHQT